MFSEESILLDGITGTILVCGSISSEGERLKPISMAAERIARLLQVRSEIANLGDATSPIYVYFRPAGGDPIPIYCEYKGSSSEEEVYSALCRMIFVLSFHPKYLTLKNMRDKFMGLS